MVWRSGSTDFSILGSVALKGVDVDGTFKPMWARHVDDWRDFKHAGWDVELASSLLVYGDSKDWTAVKVEIETDLDASTEVYGYMVVALPLNIQT